MIEAVLVTCAAVVVPCFVTALLTVVACIFAARYARRRVALERKSFAVHDRNTWRTVVTGSFRAIGSVQHMAEIIQENAPAGIVCEFRQRPTRDLELGRVRVSFELGQKEPS